MTLAHSPPLQPPPYTIKIGDGLTDKDTQESISFLLKQHICDLKEEEWNQHKSSTGITFDRVPPHHININLLRVI